MALPAPASSPPLLRTRHEPHRATPVARAPGPGANALGRLVRLRAETEGRRRYLEAARSDRSTSFAELGEAVDRWAGLLDHAGVAVGETVAIRVADPLDFCVAFLGTMAGGRWAAPLDPRAPEAQVSRSLAHASAGALVTDAALGTVGDELVRIDCPPGALDAGRQPIVALRRAAPRAPRRLPGAGAVLVTSGTTGDPKVVRLPVGQLLVAAGQIARHHRITKDDRGFNALPLFHVNAEVVGVLAQLVAGSCLVLDDRFHRHGFWELMGRRRISWINAVPAIIARLGLLEIGEAVPPGIRFARSASAPLPVATLERFESATGIPVIETYGMTEAASQIAANPIDGPRKPGTVGRAVGVELRLVPAGTPVGRIEIRGPSVIAAYGGATGGERFGPGGWLDTGDLGHLDADGYLTIVGRSDDVINRGGEKIFPGEVEEVIATDPDVLAAAVVPRADDVLGQVPVAYLVLRGAPDPVSADRVLQRVDGRLAASLASAHRPVALHVVTALPVGPTGKVRRGALAGDPPAPSRTLCPGRR